MKTNEAIKNELKTKINEIVKINTFEGLFVKKYMQPEKYTTENEKRFNELFELKKE